MIRFILIIALGLLCAPLVFAQDGEPRNVATHGGWMVYEVGAGADKICYLSSVPIKKLPEGVRRGEVFFSISHRPRDNVWGEIGVRVGYPFSVTSRPYAVIGGQRYQFFTGASLENGVKEWAWLSDIKQQDAMLNAMRRGNTMVFRGTSERGTLTTDTYTLLGITRALSAIDSACPPPAR